MKIFLYTIVLFSITSFASDKVSCDAFNDKPKLIQVRKAPSFGPYIKTNPYYVTSGKNDPFSEELLYFVIAKELNKTNSSIGSSSDYLKFHAYYKKKADELQAQVEAWEVVGLDKLLPIIKDYLNLKGLKISNSDFQDMIDKNQSEVKVIKEILAFTANTTYYEISPIDCEVSIDRTTSLPQVTLKNEYGSLRITIAASKLTHYNSVSEEDIYKKELVKENREMLSYIEKILPSSGAPVKGTIKMWLDL